MPLTLKTCCPHMPWKSCVIGIHSGQVSGVSEIWNWSCGNDIVNIDLIIAIGNRNRGILRRGTTIRYTVTKIYLLPWPKFFLCSYDEWPIRVRQLRSRAFTLGVWTSNPGNLIGCWNYWNEHLGNSNWCKPGKIYGGSTSENIIILWFYWSIGSKFRNPLLINQ